MALKRDWIPSPNYSSRGGSGVRLVIIHTAEGATTYKALGNYFASGSAGVSSHVGIDDTPGKIGEYVKRPDKAWTSGETNPVAIQAECCAFASWSPADWKKHPNMLDNCARWIAEECKHYGIPIVKLGANEATHGGRGVCGHVDVSGPGGHWDPGNNFPWKEVIAAAKSGGPVYGAAPAPASTPRALPVAALAAGTEEYTVLEYCIHDTSEGFSGSGNIYGVYSSGLVRRMVQSERNAIGVGGADGVPLYKMDMSKESSNIYHQFDQALRGWIAERK
jgi:hypothetical protein